MGLLEDFLRIGIIYSFFREGSLLLFERCILFFVSYVIWGIFLVFVSWFFVKGGILFIGRVEV